MSFSMQSIRLNISQLSKDKRFKLQPDFNPLIVHRYTGFWNQGHIFPRITICIINGENIIIDGFHRVEALRESDVVEKVIGCSIFKGTEEECREYAKRIDTLSGYHANEQTPDNIDIGSRSFNLEATRGQRIDSFLAQLTAIENSVATLKSQMRDYFS